MTTTDVVMRIEHVSKVFTRAVWRGLRRSVTSQTAVNDVSFTLRRGETIGVVGESGSGKTTLARMLAHLVTPTSGTISLNGEDIHALAADAVLKTVRPAVRMVFQDPDAILNPAYAVGVGLHRALSLQGDGIADPQRHIEAALAELGLDASFMRKYPDEMSGGEKRRIGICRALLTNPEVIVADEPLSGLDVVLQEMVLGILVREQQRRGFGMVIISHDLDRVSQVCDHVLVMHAGRVVEHMRITREDGRPLESYRHPYSIRLRNASVGASAEVFATERQRENAPLDGGGAQAVVSHTGCSVVALCERSRELGQPSRCAFEVPALRTVATDHQVACHFVEP